jgi:serine/threonine-protein kinase HipA
MDFDLVRSVGEFFMLDRPSMDKILTEVTSVVRDWRKYATAIGIPKPEQDRMAAAFMF